MPEAHRPAPRRLAVQPQPVEGAKTVEHHDRGCPRTLRELRFLLGADLFRYAGDHRLASALKHYLFTPGFKYTVWMRSTGYMRMGAIRRRLLYPIFKLILLHMRYKYGFAIPEYTVIGPGLFLNRFGGFYIHGDTIIGSNVNILPGSMLGYTNRGARMGAPIIGDRAFIGHGAKVIGRVFVGDDCSIGVNSVVTKDLPPMSVAVGMPAKVVGEGGSVGYVNRQADIRAWPAIARD